MQRRWRRTEPGSLGQVAQLALLEGYARLLPTHPDLRTTFEISPTQVGQRLERAFPPLYSDSGVTKFGGVGCFPDALGLCPAYFCCHFLA